MKIARWVGLALVLGTAPAGAQRYFGMNQVEYRHLRWRVIETEHFYVHYYPEEQVAAHDAARMAERSYTRLSHILGHQFREKKPILLFASRADFGQNNVTGDLGEGTGGVTDASRQRIMLPFTGDYTELQHVLTHEMVHQFQYDVFSHGRAGDNLQLLEQVNPPLWVMEGMAEYLSLGPNHTLTTTWIRDAVVNGNLPTIKQMTNEPYKYFPYRYGEALWRYIGERWGDAVIGEILQTIATNGIERGFQRELGMTLDQLSEQWREATRAQYLPQLATMDRVRDFAQPLLNPKRTNGAIFLAPVLSPDGRTIAFLANGSEKKGEIFIDLWLGDATTGKRIRRLVRSTTNPSFEELRLLYSQGSFSPDSRFFAFTAQTGGRDVLSIVDVLTGSVTQLTNIPLDAVLSPSYAPDGKHIVFSGMNHALTDIYIVDTDGRNLRMMTKDRYADLQPSWSPDGKWIAFATDRASTNLTNLTVGKLQIAVMNVDDGTITVLPNQAGLNINPVWSPDGQSLAYVSDRNGTPNIYLHNLQSKQDARVTNVQGGVSAITEYSPAITWSRGTDRLAFTYYDNNDYTVWVLDHPEALAKPIPAVTTAAPPAADTTTKVTASGLPAPKSVKDSTPGAVPPEQTSIYRSVYGARPSSQVTGNESQSDSGGTATMAALLADANTGLPDTLTFKTYPYSIRFTPDYISGGSIGVAGGGSYGTTFGGGTTVVLSDLTGDHELAIGAGIYGRLSDASFLVGYADLSHRLQYTTGVSQDIAYIYAGGQQIQLQNGIRNQYVFTRYAFRSVSTSAAYPFSRFSRLELGASFNMIGRSVIAQNDDILTDGVYVYENLSFQNLQTLSTLRYVSPSLSFVSDNTLEGTTGPITGRRMRFSAAPSVGNVHWIEYLGDYRRYDPVIFNTITFATRLFTDVTVGQDDSLFPKYIGTPDFVRGYDQSSFYNGYSCQSFLGTPNTAGQACSTVQLVGTRVAVANEELRFPIIRRFDLGSLPIGLPPVDGLFFYDAGLAWSSGQSVSLTKPKNYDYTIQRYVMRSYGVGVRANLFNLLLLRWDLAKPLNRDGDTKWNWTFSLGPSF
jgi:Tol biopolymer transport system component